MAASAWCFWFREFPHEKDEALAIDLPHLYSLPVADLTARSSEIEEYVERLELLSGERSIALANLLAWLRHAHGLNKPSTKLGKPFALSEAGFLDALGAALPKGRLLGPKALREARDAYAETVAPARDGVAEEARLERRLSDLVNAAYGLTEEEVALMWRTAPPRMLVPPPSASRA